MSPDHHCDPDHNREVPINGRFLDSEPPISREPPAECSEDDENEVPMLRLDSVGGGAALPPPSGVQGGGKISPGENFVGKISPLRKVAKFSPGEILA